MTSSETWFIRAAKFVAVVVLVGMPGCTVVTVGVTTNGNDEGETVDGYTGPGSATWGGEVGEVGEVGGEGGYVVTTGEWPWDSDGDGATSGGTYEESADSGATSGGPYEGTTAYEGESSGSSDTASTGGPEESSSGGETSTSTTTGWSGSEGSSG